MAANASCPTTRCTAAVALTLSLAAITGCSSKPSVPGAHLAGAVQINGQPIEEGTITFTPSGNSRGKAVGTKISAGRFDCPYVPLGESLVQIYALKPTGKM